MVEFIPIERTESYAPNIVGVVNWPEYFATSYSTKEKSPLLVRGHIFDIHLNEIYGGLERAILHFLIRTEDLYLYKGKEEEEKGKEEQVLFSLGFVKGKIWPKKLNSRHDRDIVYTPYVPSNGGIKTEPILVKDPGINAKSDLGKGGQTGSVPKLNGDIIKISAAELYLWDRASVQSNLMDYFSQNLPEIPGIKYLHEQKRELVKEKGIWKLV